MVSSAQNSSLAAVHFFERIFCKSSFCHQYFHKYHFYRFIKLLYDHKEATLAAKSETQKRSVELKYINVLCGNHGKHNKSMVPCVSQIMGKNKTFPLNQKLTCANHGIYVATCVICHEQYVEQTKNKFSTRWSSHRSNWNRPNCEIDENNKD